MTTTPATVHPRQPDGTARGGSDPLLCPFAIEVSSIARFLNAELVDHPVYDGFELQWFDDDDHGTGLLAFLSRRADRRVDYYVQPGLCLEEATYELGAGTGGWYETTFEAARLEVTRDGVDVDVRFRDVDGRSIEVRIDDRDGTRRRPGALLAPVSDGIDDPSSLLLVFLHGFELVRRGPREPVIRIDGVDAAIGRLPGARLHRRHLIKHAGPLAVATVCPAVDAALDPVDPAAPGRVTLDDRGRAIAGVVDRGDGRVAELVLDPPLPPLAGLAEARRAQGTWRVSVDDVPVTGGDWYATRRGDTVRLGLDVTQPWVPRPGLPWLMRTVTRVVPTFRRWPLSYRWRAEVTLGERAHLRSRWERTTERRDQAYRRATQR